MLERISYLVILVLLLAGCRQGVNDSAGLVELDSLIAAAPDSAAARLADWPADSLRTAGDRAYHALLLTQARYKAYIPATSDSAINLAVAYYSDGDDYDRWIRSLIYKVCVMSELNQPDSAMFWFKRAETIARPGDHANLGYINFRIADIYQYEYVAPKQAVDSYNQALAHYRKSNQSFYEMACLSELASLSLLTSGTIDYQCFTAALCKSMMLNDMDYICANLTTLAASYFFQKEYHKSMDLLSAVLAIPASETVKSKCHLMLAQNYATESMADSALWHLEQASIQTSVDSMLYCRSMALVNSGKGNISEFKIHDETADRIAHNLLMRSAATELKETEAEYDLRLSEVGNQSIKLKILLAGLVLFIVVMLVVALVIIRRLKVNQQNEALSELNERLQVQECHSIEMSKMTSQMRASLTKQQALIQQIKYLQQGNLPEAKQLSRIKELISDFHLEPGFWRDAFMYTNMHFSNIIDILKEKYPKFTETYAKVLALVCCGCSNADIMVIMGFSSMAVVRNYKSKITHEIMNVDIKLEDLAGQYESKID